MCTCTSALTQRRSLPSSHGRAGRAKSTSVVEPARTSTVRRSGARARPFISSMLTVPAGTVSIELMKGLARAPERSEEHTSELQSHSDLVCRLLLEKKKKRERYRQQTD